MDSLNDDKVESFQKAIFHNAKEIYQLDSKGTVYDLTNTYFYGKQCPIGKLGKSKEGKRQNDLIQIALATTQKEGLLVFHKVFNGNIHDSKTLSNVSDSFLKYNLLSGLFIYNRDIVSEKNLNFIGKLGWHTLCGLPLREKEKNIIRKFLQGGAMSHISNMVQVENSTFYVKGVSHSFGSIKGKMVICYNKSKRLEIVQSRRLKILESQKLRKEGKKIEESFEVYLTPTGRIRDDVLEKEEEFDGYSCIFCTKNISDKHVVRLYFDKDIIEKAFRTLKGISNVRPIRFWLNKRVIVC